MNTAQIASLARILIVAVGSILVGRGWATQEQVDFISDATLLTAVIGGVAALAAAVYGVWMRRPAGIVASAAKLPEVSAIKAAPKLVDRVDDAKVTVR
ncbi:peroxiredoxin [Methylorubrum zatmanii]|nr:peroxiredoxin [Methylorubrum zatmanii]